MSAKKKSKGRTTKRAGRAKRGSAKKGRVTRVHAAGKAKRRPAVSSAKSEPHLFMFHGTECPHCRNMDEDVERLERELKVKVAKLEVWHNPKNAELLEKVDRGMCGGVPFFWNAKTKKYICGETDYDSFKDWAEGK